MFDPYFPVASADARISSGIGRRNAPVRGASTNHRGIDIAAPAGSPVIAPVDLRVTHVGNLRGYGQTVYGVDEQGREHRFAHLSGYDVRQGQTIAAGSQLGRVGMTGTASGNHLHYEVRDRGGNLLAGATNAIAREGERLLRPVLNGAIQQGINAVLGSNPITAALNIGGAFDGITGGLGVSGGGCGINPICHLRAWIEETSFVSRGALFIVGIIFIIGAIAFLALGYNPKNIAQNAISSIGK